LHFFNDFYSLFITFILVKNVKNIFKSFENLFLRGGNEKSPFWLGNETAAMKRRAMKRRAMKRQAMKRRQ